MRKKLVIWAMFALVALVTVTPALAAGNGGNDRSQQFFSVLGGVTEVTDVDVGQDTITVLVVEGSRLVWPYIDGELTVQMTNDTLYYEWTSCGLDPITLGAVDVGATTNIHGTVTDDVFTADRVTVLSPPDGG